MRRILTLIFMCFLFLPAWTQVVSGVVMDGETPLPGASVYWMKSKAGTVSNENGEWQLPISSKKGDRLIAAISTYLNDTLAYTGQEKITFSLEKNIQLEGVLVEEQMAGTHISKQNPIKTEIITERELEKAACCDLGGCFETEASVEPTTTNVITQAKELRILGLSGVYNQVLIEGFPVIQGLTYTYGISAVPGPLVRKIYVAKGANSVLQGYESIAGQINVELKEPENADRIFLNGYMNSFLEKQFNGHYAHKGNGWSTLLAVNTVQPARKTDRDTDGFLDLPLLTRYHALNKWMIGDDTQRGFFSVTGLRFVHEDRTGGQVDFDPEVDLGDTNVYGQTLNYTRPEFYTKTGYRVNDRHKFTAFLSGFYQDQDAWFGVTQYRAQQTQIYGNLQHDFRYKDKHTLKTGVSLRVMELAENISFHNDPLSRTYDGFYLRNEIIPGVFAENNLRLLDGRMTWMLGARLDHHNTFGSKFTPRSLVKLDVGKNGSLRASAGLGWRTVNLFSENINLLASSRNIIFAEPLEPETAVNYGINYTHSLYAPNIEGTISVDLYRTSFGNQVFPDYDTPGIATIQNFKGPSISNSFQIETGFEFFERFDIKVGYNFLDVYREIGGEKFVLPFNSMHRINGSAGYRAPNQKWHWDANAHWYGKQRLAKTVSNPPDFQTDEFSRSFAVFNTQFTWTPGAVELYGGCENIFDFRQRRPIVGYQDPFGPFFDTSSVWGPTKGREFYIGVRFSIE